VNGTGDGKAIVIIMWCLSGILAYELLKTQNSLAGSLILLSVIVNCDLELTVGSKVVVVLSLFYFPDGFEVTNECC
jgi:hypothetical protein